MSERSGRIRTALIASLVIFAAGAAGYWLSTRMVPAQPISWAEVTLPDSTGKLRSLDEWRGQPLVVNFWATWCKPCLKEIPDLIALRGEFGDTDLEVLGIAVDRPDAVLQFLEELPITYPVLLDDGRASDLLARFGNSGGGLPFTVTIERDGSIDQRQLGAIPKDQIRALIERLL